MATNNTRQAAWVAIGGFFSFLVGIVSPMILSRYFDKGDYGTYKQVMYVYNTLLVVFTLGLPKAYAYFLPKYPIEQAKSIINKITSIFWLLGLLFSMILFLASGFIADVMNNPDLKSALQIFSPVPLLLLPTMGLEGIFASFKKTQILAVYQVVTRILTILFVIIPVVFFKGNYIHAIIGFDIASLLTCLIALFMKSQPIKSVCHETTVVSYKDIFKFSLPLLYASLWGVIIASANQFFISRYYGNEVFAEYSNGFMEMPVASMVLSAVATVLLPLFSGMDKGTDMTKEVSVLWGSALVKSAKLIFPILVFSVFFAKLLMTCMYGDIYENSTLYFQIKNISSLLYIIPFAPIILAIGKTKEYANIHLIMAFIVVGCEWLACQFFKGNAIPVAIVSEVCQALKIILLMRVIAAYSSKTILDLIPLKQLCKLLVACIFSSTIAVFIVPGGLNKFAELFFSLLVFSVVYYAVCWFLHISYKEIARGFIKQRKLLQYIP